MADVIYNRAKGPIDITDLRAMLLVGYTPNADHGTLTEVIAAATKECDFTGYTRKALTGVAWTVDNVNNWAILGANDPLWEDAGGAANNTVSHMVVYEHHSDSDDDLNLPGSAHGTGFPFTTDGTAKSVKIGPSGFVKSA